MLDQAQIISGLSILLSFFVGYRYALKISESKSESDSSEASSSSKVSTNKISLIL